MHKLELFLHEPEISIKTYSAVMRLWRYGVFIVAGTESISALTDVSFTPKEIAAEIKKHIPDFTISYKPDFRQKIADSWPGSIDDSCAREDYQWKQQFDMSSMTVEMLENLK